MMLVFGPGRSAKPLQSGPKRYMLRTNFWGHAPLEGQLKGTAMKTVTLSAIALSIAITGFSGSAFAQSRTEPAGKLFFEGDIVLHRLDGQQGPFCVLQNQFTRGEAVAWRIRAILPSGEVATGDVLRGLEVELGNGERLATEYRTHGNPATDAFWSVFWTVPDDFPTGSLGYKVHATMQDDSVVTWEPFTRPATQLMVVEGEPQMADATP